MVAEVTAGVHHPVVFHPLGEGGTNTAVKDNTVDAARNPPASEATVQGISTLQQIPSTLETITAVQKQSQQPTARDIAGITGLGLNVDTFAYTRADYLIYLTAPATAFYSIL